MANRERREKVVDHREKGEDGTPMTKTAAGRQMTDDVSAPSQRRRAG
jgi:hypothetical protein